MGKNSSLKRNLPSWRRRSSMEMKRLEARRGNKATGRNEGALGALVMPSLTSPSAPAMEDDGGYITMSKAKGKDPSPMPELRAAGTSPPQRCYRGAVVLLSLLLIPAVILLSIHIFQERGDTRSEVTLAQLKQSLCDPAQDDTSAEKECKLCPKNWLAYREKCYWLSKQSWVWNESKRDCEGRRARMLIIRDLEEMNFISNITERSDHVWIGLHLPASTGGWTWVDGAPLDQLLFRVSGSVEKESCGVVKAKRISSETCQAEFKWVCEREATRM